ncbi:unnamed protein product [Microthlaspi erraticum]|uniref:DUF8039 domain-containing protein n=1 Tax=Microthlaspi erraticum TaxID=1685480 RepID=A0A6D2K0S3_9BRAS|nr:unnamed protein product [Microthlaspi erraticum]
MLKTGGLVRRSKRQQGLDVSPLDAANLQKNKKNFLTEGDDYESDRVSEENVDAEDDTEIGGENENGDAISRENQMTEGHSPNGEEWVDDVEVEQPVVPPNTVEVTTSTEEVQTQQSESKKRKTRGPTKMRKVAKNHEDKVEVEFTSLGEHVGSGSVTLSSFVGPLVREHVPVLLDDWRHLDEQTRETLWEEIQGRFNLKESWQKETVFRQMGCLWRTSKSKLVTLVRATKNKSQLQKLKPSNIQSTAAWNAWVKKKTSHAFAEQSERYRQLRKGQIPHTTSRKGMTRLAHDMKKKSSDPSKITRSKVWVAGHTHFDGRPVREEFADTIEQIKSIDSEMDSTSTDNMLDSHVQKLEATQAELLTKLEELRNVVSDLAAKKIQNDDVYAAEFSEVKKGGIRCQLLDWYAQDDVVIGEGEFCSSEPTYMIGRIPLGPNATAVTVKSASVLEASVWRPFQTIVSLGQAVGFKIAWPSDKIILDDDVNSSQPPNTVGSEATDASIGRVQIFDWNTDNDLIAEGVLLSTDPKEFLNHIPLGPNAAIVKVDIVLKADAYLWRPNEEISKMGDAVNQNIAWPIHKIHLATATTPDGSTKKSPLSGSNSSGSSKGGKQKCILLDCNGSGQRVAVGRVSSTDPAEKVHFVPLGLNASKVWVEVSKVDDAQVWRPNSEVAFVSDAVGTTVAWPNDKLVLL